MQCNSTSRKCGFIENANKMNMSQKIYAKMSKQKNRRIRRKTFYNFGCNEDYTYENEQKKTRANLQ